MAGKKPELILPAGSMDALKAAVLNGADAVYFGAKKFNARIPAENFDLEKLKDAIDFCHLHGKKAYLTLNTLIKDSELDEAIETAKQAYCFGIDAVILQDLGLIKALRELLPELELHASTQVTCHNSEGASFLQSLGIKRIVLARELSLEEVKAIKKNSSTETEVFVHGALCFSYSGQCLFSSFLFNKSGNRGMCLQPCRLAYSLKNTDGKTASKGYVLSMKDLITANSIKGLIEAGIDSFKIEGRLKGVEYVAAAARVYRKAIDAAFGEGKGPSEEEIKLMRIAFMREPTQGYLLEEKELVSPEASARKGIPAAKVLGFFGGKIKLKLFENLLQWDRLSAVKGDEVEEFSAAKIFKGEKEIRKAFAGEVVLVQTGKKPYLAAGQELYFTSSRFLKDVSYASLEKAEKVEYDLRVEAAEGKPLKAIAAFSGKKVEIVFGEPLKKSKTKETTSEMLKEKIFKGNDFFAPKEFHFDITGSPFVPLSDLKKFKNKILEEMRERLFAEYRKPLDEKEFLEKKKALLCFKKKEAQGRRKQEVVVFAQSLEVAEEAVKLADCLVFYDSLPKKEIEEFSARHPKKKIFAKSAGIQSDEELAEFEKNFLQGGGHVVVSNLGALNVAIKNNAEFLAGRELNVFNSLAAALLVEKGAQLVVPSVECSLKQLRENAFSKRLVPLVFFYPQLMVSKAYAKSGFKGEFVLEDRKRYKYKAIIDEHGLFHLYNPLPVDMLFEMEKFSGFSAVALDFTAAEKSETKQALGYLAEKLAGKAPRKKFAKFTRGHYDKEAF